jgi:hypothetical protein
MADGFNSGHRTFFEINLRFTSRLCDHARQKL